MHKSIYKSIYLCYYIDVVERPQIKTKGERPMKRRGTKKEPPNRIGHQLTVKINLVILVIEWRIEWR